MINTTNTSTQATPSFQKFFKIRAHIDGMPLKDGDSIVNVADEFLNHLQKDKNLCEKFKSIVGDFQPEKNNYNILIFPKVPILGTDEMATLIDELCNRKELINKLIITKYDLFKRILLHGKIKKIISALEQPKNWIENKEILEIKKNGTGKFQFEFKSLDAK